MEYCREMCKRIRREWAKEFAAKRLARTEREDGEVSRTFRKRTEDETRWRGE